MALLEANPALLAAVQMVDITERFVGHARAFRGRGSSSHLTAMLENLHAQVTLRDLSAVATNDERREANDLLACRRAERTLCGMREVAARRRIAKLQRSQA